MFAHNDSILNETCGSIARPAGSSDSCVLKAIFQLLCKIIFTQNDNYCYYIRFNYQYIYAQQTLTNSEFRKKF